MKLYKTRSSNRQQGLHPLPASPPAQQQAANMTTMEEEEEKNQSPSGETKPPVIDLPPDYTFSFELPPPPNPHPLYSTPLHPYATHLPQTPRPHPNKRQNHRKSPRCHASTLATAQQTTGDKNIDLNPPDEYIWDAVYHLSDGYVVGLLNKLNPVVKLKDIFRGK